MKVQQVTCSASQCPAVTLCGVRIDRVTLQEAVDLARHTSMRPYTVTTPNAVMLEAARRESTLQQLLNASSLSLPDGAGVLMAAKRKREVLPARVSGIDFGEALLAALPAARVYLLGGKEGVAAQAAAQLSRRYPDLAFVGTHHGYFADGSAEEHALLEGIRAARPDLLYVCLGFPRQERWIAQNAPNLPSVRIAAALGGSLDVWSGSIRRAPSILSQMGLEWAWRMAKDPHKLSRLPALIRFSMLKKEEL